jgi:selenocysteine lyase/cysteine desulfurase
MDVQALRMDTPGCAHRIHLNNAGAGLMPGPVIRAIKEHVDLEARIGGYEAAREEHERVREAYASVGRLIGASPENIAITENATAAFNVALSSIPFREGDVLLTTRNDYVSNQIAFLSLQERVGVRVVRAPDRAEGGVDPAGLEELVHRLRPRLVSITHVPTNSGLVQGVEDVAEICRRRDVPLLVDACQSVGQMRVDVREIPCDFLSATGRKFLRGPRGIGFLYVSDRALERGLEPLFPDLHGADWIEADLYQPAPNAQRFENWEFAYALVLGLGAAADYAFDLGIDAIERRVHALANELRERLAEFPSARVLDRGERRAGIVTLTVDGRDPSQLVDELNTRGINTGASTLSYALLDFGDKQVEGALRVSPHYYNTGAELDAFIEAMRDLA